jgi:hypothetical protein
MEFDPRDDKDSRDHEGFGPNDHRRGGSDDGRDGDDLRQPEITSRDPDHEARDLGLGPGDSRQSNGDNHGNDPVMVLAGPPATAVTNLGMYSRVTWTYREDASARSSAIETASTPCAVLKRERSRPSARFEWSPVVISATTAIDRSTLGPVICGICASWAWLRSPE